MANRPGKDVPSGNILFGAHTLCGKAHERSRESALCLQLSGAASGAFGKTLGQTIMDAKRLDAFKKLEQIKNDKGLTADQEDAHRELVAQLGGVVRSVYYICLETGQPCDPQNPPQGCTCKQMAY